MELSEFDVWYRSREAIKPQFLAEFTPDSGQQIGDQGQSNGVVCVDGSST